MKNKPSLRAGLCTKVSTTGLTLALSLSTLSNASAIEVKWLDGEIAGNFDTSVSYGAIWRTQKQDEILRSVGVYSEMPFTGNINRNDGNNNFNKGLVSSTVKITSELDLVKDNYGAFFRASAFYDERIMDHRHDGGMTSQHSYHLGDTFPEAVKDQAGSDARFLDAYVWGDFYLGEMPLNVRFGEQVISWGEALFLQDGINQANPANLAALRLPGSEVKEALLPLPMLYFQLGLTNNITLEAFYEFGWENSEGDPVGTFLSTSDSFVGKGAEGIILDLSENAEAVLALNAYNAAAGITDPYQSGQLRISRRQSIEPDDNGQYGVALRVFAERLNNTEFGFYYMNYHSRKQVAGVETGDAFGVGQDGSAACSGAKNVFTLLNMTSVSDLSCSELLLLQSNDPNSLAARVVSGMNYFYFIDTTEYFFVFPEDIEMYGFSFNTSVGDISLAGELAYRPKNPFLPEMGDNVIAYNALAGPDVANGGSGYYGPHLGYLAANETVLVQAEKETYNLSLVALNNFGKVFGADRFLGILELGAAYVAGIEDYDPTDPTSKLYASTDAYPYIPYDPYNITVGDPSQYLDAFSWGYRLVFSASYNDVYAGINVDPFIRYNHDVSGNSTFGGNFMEGRKSANVGFEASYLVNLSFRLSYATFWGAEDHNLLGDRDHVSASVRYSF